MGGKAGLERALFEGHVIERAAFWGRITGAAIIFVLGPIVTPAVPQLVVRGLGLYFLGYALLMLRISARATTAAQQRQAAWLAHAFDTFGFLAALVLSATDSAWLATDAAPLYIVVAVSRLGMVGGVTAAIALSVTHVGLAVWRASALGIELDPARDLVHIAIYGLAALLTTAIDSEMRALRRAQAVSEMERTQRLESLGSLAGGIAHDFNNLLAVILNNAHLAAGRIGDGEGRREVEEIRHTAERGVSLTRQMLVFARGARPRAGAPIDVHREVLYAERLLRRTIGEDIALDVEISPDVRGAPLEPGQLEQVLMNLVVNARDAMPRGGRIAIDVSEVDLAANEVATLPAGRYVRLAVRDEGTGMSPEVASHAFDPFFTTKPKGRGTGLGLAMVYGIARRAGGHVTLRSEAGRGTEVTLDVPAAPLPSQADRRATIRLVKATGQGQRVLVVDDEAGVRRVAARILREAGYDAAEAALPSEALARSDGRLDLLVTDVVLPGMSGRDLAQRLRERKPDLPVLFVSGHAPGANEEDPSLLAKPFTPELLLSRVREALRTPMGVA